MMKERFLNIRKRTEALCADLQPEDYVVQLIVDISPPKWHLGHTTWFFETFILVEFVEGYQRFNEDFPYIFNSYYETLGERVLRDHRGDLSRPLVSEVYDYRAHVDAEMSALLEGDHPQLKEILPLVEVGLQHEQQHQELMVTDVKYIFGMNPIFPVLDIPLQKDPNVSANGWVEVEEGVYDIGHRGDGFAYDNELGAHKVFVSAFAISEAQVTNGEFIRFIEAGGYQDFRYWHAEGWDWVKNNNIEAPEYWHKKDGRWMHYDFNGLQPVDPNDILVHISFYEAFAFAEWKGLRLPTEFEWEVASERFQWGNRWEWTYSAYLPYPGYEKADGALGEYNGKFMVNQMVLRGASLATPEGHSRNTYRNFFHPWLRWQYTGIRLAK